MHQIRHYGETSIKPKESLTWDDVLFFLWNGEDPRFCGSREAAEACITSGLKSGDALAVYESFPCLIQDLLDGLEIDIDDMFPVKNAHKMGDGTYHVNLHSRLDEYRKHIRNPPTDPERIEAWSGPRGVLKCLEKNSISTPENQEVIAKALYNNLLEFVTDSDDRKVNAMVVARVTSMQHSARITSGGLCKRGNAKIPAADFLPWYWTCDFGTGSDAEILEKRKRAIGFMFLGSDLPAEPAAGSSTQQAPAGDEDEDSDPDGIR